MMPMTPEQVAARILEERKRGEESQTPAMKARMAAMREIERRRDERELFE